MAKRTVSEIIFNTLVELGVTDCFCVVGGGAMHLDHALGTTAGMDVHFNHHEQACAMAGEAYGRFKGTPAVVCVTSGPGATNALTGVMGAWVDSIPLIVISGNVRSNVSVASTGLPLRYRGIQEFDIITSVRNMTKSAKVLLDPKDARASVIEAYELATTGRRGPVWIDVPLDIQSATIDEGSLHSPASLAQGPLCSGSDVAAVFEEIKTARRPCVLFGSGVTTSGLYGEFEEFLKKARVPVVGGAWLGDSLALSHPLYYGTSGNVGPRVGNLILQNADYILVLGNSLSYKQTGYKLETFAPDARITMVEVDENEEKKLGGRINRFIHASLESFFGQAPLVDEVVSAPNDWVAYCDELRARFSLYEGGASAKGSERVNKYCFAQRYNEFAPHDQVTVLGNSQVGLVFNQIGKPHDDQRIISNLICGSMGYDLPAAVGAAVAARRPVVCITGDGSFMMNLQELQTIRHLEWPVKVVVFENGGYGGIRQTWSNYFESFSFGDGPESGVTFPSFERIAYAFDLKYKKCETNDSISASVDWLFAVEGPALLEVSETDDDPVVPKLVSKLNETGGFTEPRLQDMSPFVDEKTLEWAMSPSQDKEDCR